MKFKRVAVDENFDLMKFLSEEGKWELGLSSVLFGVRVRLGRAGSLWCNLDYCAGDDAGFALVLLATVAGILERFPETVSGGDIEAFFPGFEKKPINLDPCWARLCELRDEALAAQAT